MDGIKKWYVLGFLFNSDLSKVILIEKARPEEQKGCLNGVGGRIEKGETSLQAMIREFKEETGLFLTYWREVCSFIDGDKKIYVYSNSVDNDMFDTCKTTTDETIWSVDRGELPIECLDNVPALIEMASLIEDTGPAQDNPTKQCISLTSKYGTAAHHREFILEPFNKLCTFIGNFNLEYMVKYDKI